MDIGTALVAHGETAIAVQPCERRLDDPTVVLQVLAGVDGLASDEHLNVATAQGAAAVGMS